MNKKQATKKTSKRRGSIGGSGQEAGSPIEANGRSRGAFRPATCRYVVRIEVGSWDELLTCVEESTNNGYEVLDVTPEDTV